MSEKGLFQHNPPEAAIQAIKWQHIGHAHAITSSKQLGIIGDRAIEDQAMIEHPRDALRPALRQKCFDRRRQSAAPRANQALLMKQVGSNQTSSFG
jgi:hypothetical protein